jgi:hypothetical protein
LSKPLASPIPIRVRCLATTYEPVTDEWGAKYCSVTTLETGSPQEIAERGFWIVTSYDSGAKTGEEYTLAIDPAPKAS